MDHCCDMRQFEFIAGSCLKDYGYEVPQEHLSFLNLNYIKLCMGVWHDIMVNFETV